MTRPDHVQRSRTALAAQMQPSASGKPDQLKLAILAEDIATLKEVAQELGVHCSATYRWVDRGVRGVRLESIRVGGKLLTSRQAVTRFLTATQN